MPGRLAARASGVPGGLSGHFPPSVSQISFRWGFIAGGALPSCLSLQREVKDALAASSTGTVVRGWLVCIGVKAEITSILPPLEGSVSQPSSPHLLFKCTGAQRHCAHRQGSPSSMAGTLNLQGHMCHDRKKFWGSQFCL